MDDLISRAAALNAIDCWHIDFNSTDGAKVQTDCWRTIKELPAVDAAPVIHGRWIEKETSENAIDEWQSAKCTSCGKYHTTPYLYYFDDYKFCPNCGARMDGEFRQIEEKDEMITILPKVMTEAEVISWINSDPNTRNPIYEEYRGNIIGEWINPFDDYNTSDIIEYGITVRCWTFKPNNELMLKTEWDV